MRALVLLSGGMDSTIALFKTMSDEKIDKIDSIAFHYGQRHALEVERTLDILQVARSKKYGEKLDNHRILHLQSGLMISKSSLTCGNIPVDKYKDVDEALESNTSDSSYIPARNSIFLAIACNQLLNSSPEGGQIVTGFRGRASVEHGGFPDGSPEFADAMSQALTIGAFGCHAGDMRSVRVWDPLNRPGRSRLDALNMAKDLDGCWEALGWSLTCFMGQEPPCGQCLPCLRRNQGFEQFGKPDPIIERLQRQ